MTSNWKDWAFIPGPLDAATVPHSTIVASDIAQYPPQQVAEAFLAIPGFKIVHLPNPSMWEWQASWKQGKQYATVGMTLFEVEPASWGGSGILDARCTTEEILAIWLTLRKTFPGIWMQHYDEMYTPEKFGNEFKM